MNSGEAERLPVAGTVHYRTGCLGFILFLTIPTIGLFIIAAFDSSLLMDLSEQRRAGWLAALTVFEWRGVNVGVLMFVCVLVWEYCQAARKILDPVAVKLARGCFTFHPTARKSPLALDQLVSIAHREGALKSDLWLRTRAGVSFRIRNVENAEAQALVALVESEREGDWSARVFSDHSGSYPQDLK